MKRTVLIVAVFYGLLLVFYLSAYAWDPSVFVVAGEQFTDPETGLYLHPVPGYDGQFYYRLALDPSARRDVGIRFDNPAYRQQRILYPVLAWLVGHVVPLPWAMLVVNYAALLAIAALGAAHTTRAGRAPEWGLLFALWPGFLVSLTRDLTEPVAIALLLAALLVRRPLWAGLLMSLAVLARETTLLAALVLPLSFGLLPVAVYGLWQAMLYSRWGYLPASGSNTLAFPPALLTQGPYLPALLVMIFSALVLMSRPPRRLLFVFLSYLALALFASAGVWAEPYAYLRALSEFYVIGALILVEASRVKQANRHPGRFITDRLRRAGNRHNPISDYPFARDNSAAPNPDSPVVHGPG